MAGFACSASCAPLPHPINGIPSSVHRFLPSIRASRSNLSPRFLFRAPPSFSSRRSAGYACASPTAGPSTAASAYAVIAGGAALWPKGAAISISTARPDGPLPFLPGAFPPLPPSDSSETGQGPLHPFAARPFCPFLLPARRCATTTPDCSKVARPRSLAKPPRSIAAPRCFAADARRRQPLLAFATAAGIAQRSHAAHLARSRAALAPSPWPLPFLPSWLALRCHALAAWPCRPARPRLARRCLSHPRSLRPGRLKSPLPARSAIPPLPPVALSLSPRVEGSSSLPALALRCRLVSARRCRPHWPVLVVPGGGDRVSVPPEPRGFNGRRGVWVEPLVATLVNTDPAANSWTAFGPRGVGPL